MPKKARISKIVKIGVANKSSMRVGHFDYNPNERVARKIIHGSQHMLREPAAIAIAHADLTKLSDLGALQIRIKDVETGHVYSANLETIKQHGFPFNRGHGLQIAMRLQWWNDPAPSVTPTSSANDQPSLFDGGAL